MTTVKRFISLFVIFSLAFAYAIPMTFASDDDMITVGEVLTSLGVDVENENIDLSLETVAFTASSSNISDQGRMSASNSCEDVDLDVIVLTSTDDDGIISESYLIAANDTEDETLELENISLSSPSASTSGSVLLYSSLDSTYDYYFLIGCNYSSIIISGTYAFRPSSIYSTLTAKSTATHSISSTQFQVNLSGYRVNSSGTRYGNEAYSSFGKGVTTYNPVSGNRYVTDVSYLWTSSEYGYASTDFLWVDASIHSFVLDLWIYYDNNKMIYIEHTIY